MAALRSLPSLLMAAVIALRRVGVREIDFSMGGNGIQGDDGALTTTVRSVPS